MYTKAVTILITCLGYRLYTPYGCDTAAARLYIHDGMPVSLCWFRASKISFVNVSSGS